MIQNNSANVELSNSQLNTLRSTTKNATEVTLKLKHETWIVKHDWCCATCYS